MYLSRSQVVLNMYHDLRYLDVIQTLPASGQGPLLWPPRRELPCTWAWVFGSPWGWAVNIGDIWYLLTTIFIDLYQFINMNYNYIIIYTISILCYISISQMMKECPQFSCHSCVKSSWCCSWWLKTFTLHKWSELGHRIQRPSFISGPRLQKAMNNSTHYTGAIFIWLHPAQRKWNTCCTSVDISWIRGSWATYLGCGSETFSLSFGIVFGL